jgi:hypothetical protein
MLRLRLLPLGLRLLDSRGELRPEARQLGLVLAALPFHSFFYVAQGGAD